MWKDPRVELARLAQRMRAEVKSTFRSFSDKDFCQYSIGQFVSNAGTWMQSVAVSWLVYQLTDSAVALGLVSFASYLPLLLLTYVGGIAADRFDRRRILLICQTLGMVQALTLTVLTAMGGLSVGVIIGLTLFLGCVTAMEVPSRQAYLPDLVHKDDLTNAIGLNSANFNTSRMIGPLLAGFFISVFGAFVCFGVNALSYAVAIFTFLRVVPKYRQEKKDDKGATESTSASFVSFLKQPNVRNVLLLAAATSMFGFQYGVLMPVIAKKILAGDSTTFGMLAAAGGVGALAGSLLLASRGKSPYLRKAIGLAGLPVAAAVIILSQSHFLLLSVVAAAVAGLSISIQFSGSNSLLQNSVPPEFRGRIMGVFSMFMLGFAPFGALAAGWFAEHFGVSIALIISATCCATAACIYLINTRRDNPNV